MLKRLGILTIILGLVLVASTSAMAADSGAIRPDALTRESRLAKSPLGVTRPGLSPLGDSGAIRPD